MMVVDKKELLDLSHSICSKAADVIRKSAEQGTSAEKRARELMPMQLAHAFFIHLGRCRTEKSRVKELTLLAGICQAMAYELSLAKEVK
ncbi:MAG: hypothetical protein IKF77_04525 [Thermoguttaceae bacterium]|nr:hypothetical protein [Thermoguttaceae bacterium]MBR3219165.1 hypothetical protein [Thermoguttaceae bacterium]